MSQTKQTYRQQVNKWAAGQRLSIKIDERAIANLKKEIDAKRKLLKLEQENVQLKKQVLRVHLKEANKYLNS